MRASEFVQQVVGQIPGFNQSFSIWNAVRTELGKISLSAKDPKRTKLATLFVFVSFVLFVDKKGQADE